MSPGWISIRLGSSWKMGGVVCFSKCSIAVTLINGRTNVEAFRSAIVFCPELIFTGGT